MLKSSVLLLAGLILFATACGRKTSEPPRNEISPLQSSQIDQALKMFEQDFKEIGINIDLHRLPVVVGKMKNWGLCHFNRDRRPKAISLNRDLFTMAPDSDLVEPIFVSVLLHEIGHCYFNRKHARPSTISTHGKFIALPGETYRIGWGPDRETVHEHSLAVSMMDITSHRMPKALRKYYVAEIARKASAKTIEDLKKYTDYEILEDGIIRFRMTELELNKGEVKILYPCSVAGTLPLSDEEKETIYLSQRGHAEIGSDGAIYRHTVSEKENALALKVRKEGPVKITEAGLKYISSRPGKFKCELDVTYHETSPQIISSCSYEAEGPFMSQDHHEFLRIMNKPFLGYTTLKETMISARKWKLNTDKFKKKPSVEMWISGDKCILEVSAKFDGLTTAGTTLSALLNLIPSDPSSQQGNKTEIIFSK